ncbi:hypothetical protein J2Z21_007166 [Streptomyces griseochromogenes]|uniref:Uncharacterized protein n=1 Tax=Streptomyces griseochromogenes TaxID=68214 RepID=A0ABS4M3E7_9ACTN|nr:hypothetical protein [Streptomyces griseochromogenes]
MDVVAYLPADPQAAEPVQMGERAFHDTALGAKSGAVPGVAAAVHRGGKRDASGGLDVEIYGSPRGPVPASTRVRE